MVAMAEAQADIPEPEGGGASAAPRLFTIPSGAPFIPSFVEALLSQRLIPGFPDTGNPLAMSAARIFVPTRRAARALASEIAAQLGAGAAILPQILPLGALAESGEEGLFDPFARAGAEVLDGVEAIPDLDRRLQLTRLILQWGEAIRHAICSVDEQGIIQQDESESFAVTRAPGQAYHMAGELAALIDEMIIEEVDWRALQKLALGNYDRYWSITLEFLQIAMRHWPAFLAETGQIDAVRRNVILAEAGARRLSENRLEQPYIVAGSTGTNAATAKLMAAIARLPKGAVVLPGLDHQMDAASWQMLHARVPSEYASGHPQGALARLLERLGAEPQYVRPLAQTSVEIAPRMTFLSFALLPPESTNLWNAFRKEHDATAMGQALAGVAYIDAATERQEAQAIAIAMREALETPGRTAALITPDRNLARRVRSELRRWDIIVDDSGGETLRDQPAGVLARLAIQLAPALSPSNPGAVGQRETDPVSLLALLHHGDLRLGLDAVEIRKLAQLIETGLLRGPALPLQDTEAAIANARESAARRHAHPARHRLSNDDWELIANGLDRIKGALYPLAVMSGRQALTDWFAALRAGVSQLIATAPDNAAPARADLEALDTMISAFRAVPDTGLSLDRAEFAAFFDRAVFETTVRGPANAHPRLKILGLLEARLLSADLNILAGLDETIWPPAAPSDAFLNRPMRRELGLPPPERRLGQTAHDFVEAMGAGAVILTRSSKRDGAPAIPSRLIQRLRALAGEEAWTECSARGRRILDLADALDHSSEVKPAQRPEPRPPLHLRPNSLSVTRIETWRRDPYAIYAERVLKLQPLEPPALIKTAADIGTALHQAIEQFQYGTSGNETREAAHLRMKGVAADVFASLLEDTNIRIFSWPRIEAALHSFTDWAFQRREEIANIETEADGRIEIPLTDGTGFVLTARADRIEVRRGADVVLVDYKSRRAPTAKEINAGFAPQLTLEAAIAERGGFENIPDGCSVAGAIYLTLIGNDGVKEHAIGVSSKAQKSFQQLKEEHLAGLVDLASQYRLEQTPYLSRPYPQFVNQYGVYDHLARVKEWSVGTGEGEV